MLGVLLVAEPIIVAKSIHTLTRLESRIAGGA